MGDFRAELAALVAAYDEHGGKWPQHHEEALWQAVERARAVLNEPAAIESWHVPRALSDKALRLLTRLPMEEIERRLRMDGPAGHERPTDEQLDDLFIEIDGSGETQSWRAFARAVLARWGAADGKVIEGQLISGWLPIDTAPRDGTRILASDYDAIEIVHWYKEREGACVPGEWLNREGAAMYPAWWQPLPKHPLLPEVERD